MNNNNPNNNIILIALNVLANLTQLESYKLLQQDLNNSDLMQELQKQDSEYLEKIIKQNEIITKQNDEILNSLKGEEMKNNAR